MNESHILHEVGDYWVTLHQGLFIVMKNGITHSESVDGVGYKDKSIAIERADYLAARAELKLKEQRLLAAGYSLDWREGAWEIHDTTDPDGYRLRLPYKEALINEAYLNIIEALS